MTDQMLAEAAALIGSGVKQKDVAARFGVHQSAISQAMRRRGGAS